MKSKHFSPNYYLNSIQSYLDAIPNLYPKWEDSSIQYDLYSDGSPYIKQAYFREGDMALTIKQVSTASMKLMTHIDLLSIPLPILALLQKGGDSPKSKIGRDTGYTFWMSITPMEIQSQEQAIINSYGDVGIGGLGMGYAAWRIATSSKVDSVTIYEKNEELINFTKKHLIDFDDFDNVEIKLADVRELKGNTHDVFFNDIYPHYGSDQIFDDRKRLLHNNSFENYWAWSQEIFLLPYQEFEFLSVGENIPYAISRPTGRINPDVNVEKLLGDDYDFLIQAQPYYKALADHFKESNVILSEDGFYAGFKIFIPEYKDHYGELIHNYHKGRNNAIK